MHLKLILKTNLPIDSALIVHFTNQESAMLAFNDTLDIDLKTGKTDYYHINYMHKDKIFNEKVYSDSGNIIISMKVENDKLIIDEVVGSPIYGAVKKWKNNIPLWC